MPRRGETAFRVVLVSTRNSTCAALAELLLRPALLAAGIEADAIRVTSAGLVDEGAATIDPGAETLLREYGGNPDGFRARLLDGAIIDDADVILTMSRAESAQVVGQFPRTLRRTFTLVEYLRLHDQVDPVAPLREHPLMLAASRELANLTDKDDVLSPVGLDIDAYTAVATRLNTLTQDLADAWVAMAPAHATRGEDLATIISQRDGVRLAPVRLQAFGVPVDLFCTGDGASALAKAVETAWSRCLRTDRDEAEVEIEAVVDGDPGSLRADRARGAIAGETLPDVMHSLASAITVRAIDQRAGQAVMLHAAGMALPDGRVVTFVAPSGTGKTTLSRTLGTRYGYVSDETVFIDPDGTIAPYPKPLSVLVDGVRGKDQVSPDADSLLPVPPVPLKLAGIVLLNRVPEFGSEPLVESVPLLAGIAELAAQVSYLPRLPHPLSTLARLIESTGGLTRVTYAEASSLVDVVPTIAGARV